MPLKQPQGQQLQQPARVQVLQALRALRALQVLQVLLALQPPAGHITRQAAEVARPLLIMPASSWATLMYGAAQALPMALTALVS